MEFVMTAEYARVLGVQTEHQPHAKHIEASQGVLVFGVEILLQNGVVELAHQLACPNRDLLLPFQKLALLFYQKLQAVILLG